MFLYLIVSFKICEVKVDGSRRGRRVKVIIIGVSLVFF